MPKLVGNGEDKDVEAHIGAERPEGAKPMLRQKRLALYAGIGAALLLGMLTVGWLSLQASTISRHLQAVTQLIPQLKEDILRDDPTSASQTVENLKAHTVGARTAANDPLWKLAGALPWIGANFAAVSEVATSSDDVAQLAAEPLVSVFQSLDWKKLAPSSKGVDLDPLQESAPKLASAAHAVRQSSERLDAIDAEALLPQVSVPLIEARGQLGLVRSGLETASDAAGIAPKMLGANAPQRYLLLMQNNAESRSSGGIPGALAVMTLEKGRLSLGEQTSAVDVGVMSPTLAVEEEQVAIYSSRLGKFMQDVNLTPDFPTSAETAQAMWERKTGERLDGVISIDPVLLEYMLDATGPVSLSDPAILDTERGSLPTKLTSQNVLKTLLSDVYAQIAEPAEQDLYFAAVAREVFAALSDGKSDPQKLLDGMAQGIAEGRLRLWSSHDQEQSVISRYDLSGSISGPSISPAQFGVYFNDGTGAKMDYYVKRTVQLLKECTIDGYAQIKVRVTSLNTAPVDAATSLPVYVTGGGTFGVPAGTVQTNIIAYGPVQSNVETAVVAGKKTGFASHRHNDRPVGSVTVRLAPGQSSTVDFLFGKIVQHAEPKLSVTPTVQALQDMVLDTIPAQCAPAA